MYCNNPGGDVDLGSGREKSGQTWESLGREIDTIWGKMLLGGLGRGQEIWKAPHSLHWVLCEWWNY